MLRFAVLFLKKNLNLSVQDFILILSGLYAFNFLVMNFELLRKVAHK